ncbi:MAG: MerR family transcriptional regulator, partial [Lachnospiraceae bacterium]|nr:MerR family transcriptional regulator [Lachnospiraceae bacterium]
ISVRTLHYYDAIGLLSPTEKSEAGYRLYDDKALETLRQILFFREFDIPLKEIKAVMEDPAFDKNEILQMQRKMLVRKKERMERLIASIDEILKGDNKMDFEVFGKSEVEEIWNSLYENCSEAQRVLFISRYGSEEEWRKQFLESAASEEAQKNFAKIVEWYGSKEKAMEAQKNPTDAGLVTAYQKRITAIMQKLADKLGTDVNALEIREIVGEYDFVAKQLYQMDDVTALMLELAASYQTNKTMQKVQDSIYGDGTTVYIGQAIQAFYS